MGSWLNAKREKQTFQIKRRDLTKYLKFLAWEAKGFPPKSKGEYNDLLAIGQANKLNQNEDSFEVYGLTYTPSDITKLLYCQPVNVPLVRRQVSNLCSGFLVYIEEQKGKTDMGGSIRGTLKVTATLDIGATSYDYITSSLDEFLVAMGAKEQ